MFNFSKRIGIDLGTANSLVYVAGVGIVLNEPTVVAIGTDDNKVLAVGNEAKEMLGRTPGNIITSRPLRDGVIADYVTTEAMLRFFIDKVCGASRFFKPEVMICVPAGVTSGNMIVDIGGGTTEAAVICLGGVVVHASVRAGGNKIDEAIQIGVRKKYGLIIGENQAEEIKIKLGSAIQVKNSENKTLPVRGRDAVTGLPRTIEITTFEVADMISATVQKIISGVKEVLEQTPPELASDIIDKGIVLSGGTSLLTNLDKFMTEATGVPCHVAENPLMCVALGTGLALENLDLYKRSVTKR